MPRFRRLSGLCLVLALLLPPDSAASQAQVQIGQPLRAVVTKDAPIYLKPEVLPIPLRTAAAGTVLEVLKELESWVQVQFQDPQFGRRIGWIEAPYLRIARPELQPMDLSIVDEPIRRPTPAAATQRQPASQDVVVARPQIREGFWFNIGLGYGSLGCDGCLGRESGLSGGLALGGTVSDRVLVGVGTTGYAREVLGEILSAGTLDARIRFYPVRTSGFFLNGGIGVGTLSYAGETEFGLGLMLGLGWDVRVGRRVSLTPFWNGSAMRNADVDANFGQLGVGVTWH